ncbi:hypothetical protein J3B02_003309 [Coemansia erecta]|nr:hypothetical protein J3B02_003309 [Coemansia erecta]
MYQESPIPLRQTLLPRSMAEEKKIRVFCDGCQRNQELVRQILSSYLPDEDDPEFNDRLGNAENYANQLRRRYPLVCGSCQRRVDERLQQQAQWVYRRELANALKKSASARNAAPLMRVQPTLRKRGMVVTWLACALVALAICPLLMWTWYLYVFLGWLPDPVLSVCSALLLALITYFSRLLNPLWLYLACNPGMRVSGLPMYKYRIAYLTWLRLAAAFLITTSLPSFVWIAVAGTDISLLLLAAFALRTRSSYRSRMSKTKRAIHDTQSIGHDHEDSIPAVDPQQTFASFQQLSFGASEANMDQDDTLAGLSINSLRNGHQLTKRSSSKRRTSNRYRHGTASLSSDEENEEGDQNRGISDKRDDIDADLMAGLDTISFGSQSTRREHRDTEDMEVDLVSLMGHGASTTFTTANASGATASNKGFNSFRSRLANSKPSLNFKSNSFTGASQPRPFEAFRFQRLNSTGLEQKMSSFSLSDSDDGDDGSYQGLFGSTAMDTWLLGSLQRLGTIQGAAVIGFVCTLLLGSSNILPLWAFWIERMLLIMAMGLATTASWRQRRRVAIANSFGKSNSSSHFSGIRKQQPSSFSGPLMIRRAAGCVLLLCLAGIPISMTARLFDTGSMRSLSSEVIKTLGTTDLAFSELVSPGNPVLLLRWPLAKRSVSAAVLKHTFFRSQAALHSQLSMPEEIMTTTTNVSLLVQIDYVVELLCVIFGTLLG